MKSLRKAIIEMRNDLVSGRAIIPAFLEAKKGLTETDESMFGEMIGLLSAQPLIMKLNFKIDQSSIYTVCLVLGDGEEIKTVFGSKKEDAFELLVEYTRQGKTAKLITE